MGTLLLVLLAQASPEAPRPTVPIAIVVSSRRDAGNALSSGLCAKLKEALAARGLAAMSEQQSAERLKSLGAIDSHACDGSRLCLAKLAELLNGIVIGVDIGKVQKFTAGHLEAVAARRVDSVAVSDFTADSNGWARKSAEEARAFAAQVAVVAKEINRQLQPVEAPPSGPDRASAPAPDAPRQASLVPPPPPPPPLELEAPRQRGPARYVVAGTLVAAAAVSLAMLGSATVDSQQYYASQSVLQGGTSSSYTRGELNRISSSANLKYSVALGTGVLAAVLAVATGYLFLGGP